MKIRYFCWCVRRGSNPDRRRRRPLWYPIPLRAHFCLYKTRIMKSESAGDLPKPRRGPLGKVSVCALARTTDRRRRRPLWYPIPLRAHIYFYKVCISKVDPPDLPKPRKGPLGKVSGCALARTRTEEVAELYGLQFRFRHSSLVVKCVLLKADSFGIAVCR